MVSPRGRNWIADLRSSGRQDGFGSLAEIVYVDGDPNASLEWVSRLDLVNIATVDGIEDLKRCRRDLQNNSLPPLVFEGHQGVESEHITEESKHRVEFIDDEREAQQAQGAGTGRG